MARLLIVYDHRPFVRLLEQALSEVGHEVVGHCWRANQVLSAAETDHDVVLMKLDMPNDINSSPYGGFALTEALVERDPNERILIFTDVKGQEYVDSARRVGAAGYLSNSGSLTLNELQEAIDTVAAGGESWPG